MLKVHNRNLGNIAILCLQGRLVTGETAALRNAVHSQSEVSAVVLDFARVNTIDAAGLGVMLELREEIESKGIEFRLTNVTKLVRRLLELTHLDSVFEITPGKKVLAAGTFGRATSVIELASCA